jgi:hypothetical protein
MVPFAAYHELVKELAQMKREGFVPTGPTSEPAPQPALPPVVQQAIIDLHVDASTERHLTRQAWELVRAGVDEKDIAAKITEGEEVPL